MIFNMKQEDFKKMLLLDGWIAEGRKLSEGKKKYYNDNLKAMRRAVGAMYVHWAEYTKKL